MGTCYRDVADLPDNDYNPRRRIDEDRIAELAASIERVGLISPLTVRRLDGDGDQGLTDIDDRIKAKITGDGPTYEVVAGTRRPQALRAIHGKTSDHEVPCQVEVQMAGNNYTAPFVALVDGLHDNVLPQGDPLRFPAPKSTSVEAVAEDVTSRTPVEVARRVRLYALPEKVWSLVDEDELLLRQAETIAGVAGEAAPSSERIDAMIELAEACVEEAWSKVECREKAQGRRGKMGRKDETALAPAKAGAGEGEEKGRELLCRVAELVDDFEEPDGVPSASDGEEAWEAVERRSDELDEEIEVLEERASRLDGLAERFEVGMEARFRGTLDGFDSRKTYCSYCGQGVTKEKIGEVREVVRTEKRYVEED